MDYYQPRRKLSFWGYFLSALLGAVVGGFLLLTFGPARLFTKFQPQQTQQPAQQPQITEVKTEMGSVSLAANKVIPSIVGITTTKVQKSYFYQNKLVQGVGSGVIADADGYIITNNHVADMNSRSIKVSLYDGREVEGRTVWADPSLDLAIVKINADNLSAAQFGDSKNIRIGEQAVAIGNPLGLKFQRTVTAGIISALNRTIEMSEGNFMEDLIQTDASINPGNSGGALINIKGEVIGINTVKVTSAEGIGFAVPINIIKPVLKSIKDTGKFVTPILGIKGFDKETAGYYDFKVENGIYIYDVVVNSPASKAGLREGDYIIMIDDKPINTMIDFKDALYSKGVGSKVKLKIKTQLGGEKEAEAELAGI